MWTVTSQQGEHMKTADSFPAFRTRDCLHWRTVQPIENGCLDKRPKKKSFSRNCMGKNQQRKHSACHSVFQEQRRGFICPSALHSLMPMVVAPVSKRPNPLTKTNQSNC